MRISVITVNRNDVNGLRKTVESVLSQTLPPFEFIVIDGASTDGSANLLNEFAGSISYSVSEPDKGIYNAMNKGIAHAHGDYCIFMNSGDCFCNPEVLRRVAETGSKADIICGNALIMTDPPSRKTHPEEITMQYLYIGSICHQAAFIGTSLLAGGYDESLKIVADRKLFLEALILKGCSYQYIDVDIVNYDVTGVSASHRFESEQEWQCVLHDELPERILLDYGRGNDGALYGTSPYEKLFREIGRRRYRRTVYCITRGVLYLLSFIIPSARFVKLFPPRL